MRRQLLLHDSLAFLTLAAVTVVLFGVTLALFRSFERHRDNLRKEWAAEGRAALARGDAPSAVTALQAALSYTPGYAPDERDYQMLLAEALAGSGHREEAASYFLTLWTVRPGDGFVNLQLARLARTHGDLSPAVEYYHAAIFGDWAGDAPVRRRECRLELADYLIERGDLPAARAELLIATGNNAGNNAVQLQIGERLAAAGDLPAALGLFRHALEKAPGDHAFSVRAGATAFALADYGAAEDLFGPASRVEGRTSPTLSARELTAANLLARDAARLQQLALSRSLPASIRSRHLQTAAAVAQARLGACTAELPATAPELNARWKAVRDLRRRAQAGNGDAQDELAGLIFATELATANPVSLPTSTPLPPTNGGCGEPTGDDLLLLLLARTEGHVPLPPLREATAIEALAAALAAGDATVLPANLAMLETPQ